MTNAPEHCGCCTNHYGNIIRDECKFPAFKKRLDAAELVLRYIDRHTPEKWVKEEIAMYFAFKELRHE